jgi:hypothetical protein
MAKTRPLPMPVELIILSKHLAIAPGPVHRAIVVITCHFWAAGAPPGGMEEETARQVAKIASGHWNAIRIAVMAALSDILPALAHEYAIAQKRRDNIRAAISEAGAKGRATIEARRRVGNLIVLDKKKPALVTADTATRYVNKKAVITPQKLAAIGKLPTDTGTSARYQDG